jgi:hypothetical protein
MTQHALHIGQNARGNERPERVRDEIAAVQDCVSQTVRQVASSHASAQSAYLSSSALYHLLPVSTAVRRV